MSQQSRVEPPDLVLLDIVMPQMDGFEVVRRLRDNPATAAMPVVMLSGSPLAENEARGMELGVHHYIPKPCSRDWLTLTVKVTLREAGAL